MVLLELVNICCYSDINCFPASSLFLKKEVDLNSNVF